MDVEMVEKLFAKVMGEQTKIVKELIDKHKEILEVAVNRSNSEMAVPPFRQFDREHTTWNIYCGQLEQHFAAYHVLDDLQRRSFLLSWVGTDTYTLLQKLFGTETIASKSYSEFVNKLTEHYKSGTHVLPARCKFGRTTF